MQRRTPSPNTQSGVSAKSKAVIYVLSKPFFPFYARVSYKQRRSKTRTPTRHRRIVTPRSGLGTVSVRLVFWKAEIQARTSVPLSGTCRSRRERPVRVLHGAFHTAVTTGTASYRSCASDFPVNKGVYSITAPVRTFTFAPQLLCLLKSVLCSGNSEIFE